MSSCCTPATALTLPGAHHGFRRSPEAPGKSHPRSFSVGHRSRARRDRLGGDRPCAGRERRTTRAERHASFNGRSRCLHGVWREHGDVGSLAPRVRNFTLTGLPGETEKFRALGPLPITKQRLVKALNKRTIDESVVHKSPETAKPRSNPLILPSQETSSHQLIMSEAR